VCAGVEPATSEPVLTRIPASDDVYVVSGAQGNMDYEVRGG
jgi:hypothetical protein